ncbi:MAG: carboxylating nicotinate-nucleotide diphosphorylase [Anaerolineae bacterium]|nr:carboxylating nicotinate-nucleotide diphosphorylase [Anaerolineae bacterium]
MHQNTLNSIQIKDTLRQALIEDIGRGDVTTHCIVPPDSWLSGRLIAKESGVVAGITVAEHVFALIDERVGFCLGLADGSAVAKGDIIATITGPGQALLSGERVALNFIQRMSGIATLTRRFVEAVQDSSAIILDTRKTAPGLRWFDKRAVQLGGGQNHRFGLFDMVLIKENHIAAAGSIGEAVRRVRDNDHQKRPIEVEVQTLAELEQTLPLHVDRILLDNMSLRDMRRAVRLTRGQTPLEASGNVTLETVAEIAATGVDYISIGALTHSVRALDISLLLKNAEAVVN